MASSKTTQQQGNAATPNATSIVVPELPSAYSSDYGRKLGSAQAAVTSLNNKIAGDLLTFYPKFGMRGEELPAEVKADLFDGYTDRYVARYASQLFMITQPAGAEYCDMTAITAEQYETLRAKYDAEKKAGKEPPMPHVIDMTAHVVMAFTQHQINFLHLRPAGSSGLYGPVYKGNVTALRTKVKNFQSGCFKALESAAQNIQRQRAEALGTKRTRTEIEFSQTIDSLMGSAKGSLLQQCKNKNGKGDPSADLATFEKARAAFLAIWTK